MKKVFRGIFFGVIGVFVLSLILLSMTTVPVGHTGILLTFGRVQDTPQDEGLHFKIPFVQRIVSMDNRVQKLEVATEAFSRDIQTVSASLVVNYQIEKATTFNIYKTIGTDYEQIIIVPATHEALKSVSAYYTAEELISQRQKVSDEIMSALNEEMGKNGIKVTSFNIIDFDFSPDYIKAVEDKQVAEQHKKQADIENLTAVEKAKSEAQRITIEAQGAADALKINAAGIAESYRLQNMDISEKNIQMEWINKWNGQLPKVQSTDSGGMILDLSTVIEEQ